MGPVHGAAFTGYVWTAIVAFNGGGNWSWRELLRLILAAFIPSGGFANIGFFRRKEAEALEMRP